MIWVVKVEVKGTNDAGWFVLDKAVNGFVQEEGDGPQALERHGCRLWETFEVGVIETTKESYESMLTGSNLLLKTPTCS